MDKKIVKTVIICIVAIVALILVENAIRGSIKVVERVKNSRQLAKEQREYENSEGYVLDTYVENTAKVVIGYINSGDYESVYNKLEPNYKGFKQYASIDEFKAEFEKYIGEHDAISFIGYKTGNGKYNCKLSVTNGEKSSIKRIFIIPNLDDFYIIPDDINEVVKADEKYSFKDKNINFSIVYETECSGHKIYSVDITNLTSNTLEGSFEGTYIHRTDGIDYKAQEDEALNIKIQPKETVRINITTKNNVNSNYAIDSYMQVVLKGKNGKTITERSIVMDYEYIEDYM